MSKARVDDPSELLDEGVILHLEFVPIYYYTSWKSVINIGHKNIYPTLQPLYNIVTQLCVSDAIISMIKA
jgi:hypothetical protein